MEAEVDRVRNRSPDPRRKPQAATTGRQRGNVKIAGIGIHPFGRFPDGYRELGATAARQALADAGVGMGDLDLVLVGNVGAEMAKGQNIMDSVGRPGIPIINVEAACASSASTLFMGAQMIESGAAGVVLCLGVEKAPRGFIAASGYDAWQIDTGLGVNPAYFALAGAGAARTDRRDRRGPRGDQRQEPSPCGRQPERDVPQGVHPRRGAREPGGVPPAHVAHAVRAERGCGGGGADELGRGGPPRGRPSRGAPFGVPRLAWTGRLVRSCSLVPGVGPDQPHASERLAAAYEEAGIGPDDLDLVECQDTDVASELLAYRDLLLCAAGEEAKLLRSGDTTLGGRIPVNPSGGLLSKGEPLGASGLGQLHELVTQLRGQAGPRQVEGARVGLSHVMGAGHNAAVVIVTA